MIHLYTGNGKGKTTASIGLAVRALGHQKKICLVQFLKRPDSGEITVLKKLKNAKVYCFGRRGFCNKHNLIKKDYILAETGFAKAQEILRTYKPDILILDELSVVLHLGLLEKEAVLFFLKNTAKQTEIVITGRYASGELRKIADLVSEIRQIKHYYKNGVKKRKAIEY